VIRAGVRRALRLALRRRDQWERDVEDEIRLHLLLRSEQLAGSGRSPDEAYAEAVQRFGPLDESRERLFAAARHRETRMHRTEYRTDLRQDIGFALRRLRRDRAWSAVTILTLAVGIGATTAVFSVASTLLLHAVPYPNPARVVLIDQQPSQGDKTGLGVSMLPATSLVRAWQTGAHSIERLEPYQDAGDIQMRESDGGSGSVAAGRLVPSFLGFARQAPIIGRMFTTDEAGANMHVVVLGETFWRTRFGADERVLGRAIWLDDSLYTIIGVLPAALTLPRVGATPKNVWLPLDMNNVNIGVSIVARLRPGTTPAIAARELDSIATRSQAADLGSAKLATRVVSPAQLVRFHDTLIMLTGAVALVLLVSCANVAHLLLSRNAGRMRELAIRTALGASRARLLRQLLTESLVVTLAAMVCGVGIGWLGLRLIVASSPSSLPELRAAHLDGTTLFVGFAAAIIIGVAFGTLGAWQSRRGSQDALKANSTSVSLSKRADRLRSAFIVSEMAVSAMLLVGATLLIRSVRHLQQTNLGFEPHGLYVVRLPLSSSRYPTAAARLPVVSELTERFAHVNGVSAVTMASAPPGYFGFAVGALEIEGEPPPPKGTTDFISKNDVQTTYFTTMGIPLLEGRPAVDTSSGAREVVVNASYAYRHWSRGHAIGRRIRVAFNGSGTWLRIVGVVGDAAPSGPMRDATAPILYYNAGDRPAPSFLIRTTSSGDAMRSVRDLIRQQDRGLRPTVAAVDDIIASSIAAPRFVMLLLGAFTLLAVALAAIGVYGVLSYTVAQRTREIGIRVALGAPSSRIARSVIGRGVALAAIGGVVGLVAAHWGTRLVEHQLHGVDPSDPASFATGALALLVTAFVACIVPTSRALAVDPLTAIRAE
jgi:putative ABC transport system permease protein